MSAPECMRALNPFLKRAEELQAAAASDPSLARVAYYCRFAAVDMGIKALATVPAAQQAAANAFLEQLLVQVEGEKAAIGVTRESEAGDLASVRNFALRVFKNADDGDRAGMGSADTARSLVAAANLFDVLRTLSVADAKLNEIAKYAKGRSVEILKAIKEGRQVPPPVGANEFDIDAELAALGGGGGSSFAAAAAAPPPAAAPLGGPGSYGSASSYPAAEAVPLPGYSPPAAQAPPSSSNYGQAPSGYPAPGYPSASSPSHSSSSGGRGMFDMGGSTAASSDDPMKGAAGAGYGGGGGGYSHPAPPHQQYGGPASYVTGAGAAATAAPAVPGGPAASSASAGLSMGTAPSAMRNVGRNGVPAAVMQDAAEYTKHALAALKEDKPDRAAQFLRSALTTLGR